MKSMASTVRPGTEAREGSILGGREGAGWAATRAQKKELGLPPGRTARAPGPGGEAILEAALP